MTFSQYSGVPVFPLSFYYSINRLCLLPSQHFPSYLFPKNVPQKTHEMTFLRLKFINFLAEHTHIPWLFRAPLGTFLPVYTPSKSHATHVRVE